MKLKKIILKLCIILPLLVICYSFYKSENKTNSKTNSKTNIEFRGMNLVAPISELKNETFEALKQNNVNYISLIPYAFVNLSQATVSYNHSKQWWGETSEGIAETIKKSHQYQIQVMLKPHLWIKNGLYTGNLDFATEKEWEKWEENYEKYIIEFAELAQKENVALFCFGTELGNPIAKRPKFWFDLISKIRKVYKGKITYAANWDDFEKIPFWKELDYIGIDAYFPLSEAITPTVPDVNSAWQKHLLKIIQLQQKINKKVVFTEFGYRNSDYAAKEPWLENQSKINNIGQANAYESLFESLIKKEWYAGGFAWKWYADDYYKKSNPIDYTPQEKPALQIIKKWYKER